jgi:hypothetical protein
LSPEVVVDMVQQTLVLAGVPVGIELLQALQ